MDMLKEENLLDKVYDNQLVRQASYGSILPWSKAKIGSPGKKSKPMHIETQNFATSLFHALPDIIKQLKALPDEGSKKLEALEEKVKSIEYPPVRKLLLSGIKDAKKDVKGWEEKLVESFDQQRVMVEKWFDNIMSGLSRWYQRYTRVIIFVVGILCCGFLNIATIMIIRAL